MSFKRPSIALAVLSCFALFAAGPAVGGEKAPKTATVKRGPLGEVVKAKGNIAPAVFERVACEPKVYAGPFKVAEAAPEGPVVKGQVLIRFDDEDYQRQLIARERSLTSARIKLQQKELDARLDEAETAYRMDDAVRRKRLADEALERFETVERKLLEEGKRYAFEGREIQIQNMREELAQLEKMYTEDDLTEETEEIVLKRNRRSFQRMLASFERAKKRYEYDMKVDLPRRHEALRMAVRKATNGLRRLEAGLPLDKKQAGLSLEKAREALAHAEEDMARFRDDGDRLSVKAPIAGIAVRGTFDGSSWTNLVEAKAYAVGKKLKARSTLYTVVDEAKLRVRTSIKEADLGVVKPGMPATVTSAATGKRSFEAEVAVVARYGGRGSHAVILRLKSGDPLLRAGLGCQIEIPKADGEDVLSVPKGCVLVSGETSYVFVVGEDGATKTEVEVGRSAAGRIVIKSGVKAGVRVLATPPKAKAADKEDDAKKKSGKE